MKNKFIRIRIIVLSILLCVVLCKSQGYSKNNRKTALVTTKLPPESSIKTSVTKYGAVGDGKTVNTVAIQNAINEIAKDGGGTVVIPEGVFISGALFFKQGVNLYLEKDAVLRCSVDMKNFPEQRTRIEGHFEDLFNPALINADGCDDFTIEGEGVLDGAGKPIWDTFWRLRNAVEDKKNFKNISVPRARLCLIENSSNVTVRGVTFKDSQFWNLHLYKCKNVTVESTQFVVPDDYKRAPSTDGIDLDYCQNVVIKNCYFSVTDDCIAAKGNKGTFALTQSEGALDENIRVSNCVMRRGGGLFTCGSEATIVKNVIIEDCIVWGSMPLLTLKLRPDTPQSYEDITIRNIKVNSKGIRVFSVESWTQYFDLQGQSEPSSSVRNISVSNIQGQIKSLGTIKGNNKTEFGAITLKNVDVDAVDLKFNVSPLIKNLKVKNVTINGIEFALNK